MWFRAFGRLVYGLCAITFIVAASTAATVFVPPDGTYVARPPVILHLGDSGLLDVTFSPAVLQQLESGYRLYRRNVNETEHAYCIERYSVTQGANDTVHIHIERIVPAQTDSANPIAITYECGPVPSIHTHPPSDCYQRKADGKFICQAGHPDLINCIPSNPDMITAGRDFHRFSMLQCSEDMFTVFTGAGIDELKAYGLSP